MPRMRDEAAGKKRILRKVKAATVLVPPDVSPPPPSTGKSRSSYSQLDLQCAKLPMTDLGNAQRFVLRHGADCFFVAEWGWLAWDGRRFNRHQAEPMVALKVQSTVRAIEDEAAAIVAAGEDYALRSTRAGDVMLSDALRSWALASQSNAHLGCIARIAQPHVAAAPEAFDADPMVLNVQNGTLRFGKRPDGDDYVQFGPHNRDDRITRLAAVVYDADATCPNYDKALAEVQPNAAMRDHLHSWGGVSLTGDVSLQRMSFWYGKGGNMKSTLLDTWAHIAGDYATTIGVESFLDQGRTRRGDQATPDLADLVGVRMLKTSEPERGAKLAEALIKTATGDEMLKVRFLHRDFFQLRVAFHLTMFGNYKPTIAGTDDGIWRRVIFVPWLVQVPDDKRDPGLLRKLKGEASGILNRLLDGVRVYLDNDKGLVLPEDIVKATAEFRIESDPLGRFLDLCTQWSDGGRVQSSKLYRLYQAWCVSAGEKAWSATAFGRALRERGYSSKNSQYIFWLDLATKYSVSDFVSNYEAPPAMWKASEVSIDPDRGGHDGDDL